MARIAVRRDAFEQGQFPPVCCKTGRPADAFNPFEFADTPAWTWILIFFGVFPFLIATAFATERFRGVLPISSAAQGRISLIRRFIWAFGAASVLCFGAGLIRFGSLIPIALAFAGLCLIMLAAHWWSMPNANLDGRDVVVLSNVHTGFVEAINAIPAAPSETP